MHTRHIILTGLMLGSSFSQALGVTSSKDYKAPDAILFRTANVISEGTRLHAEIFAPKSAGVDEKLPTIVLCHGWAGLAAHLRREGVAFARAGYLVVSFDYHGWGESDGRVVLSKPVPDETSNGRFSAEVKEIREVMDPVAQVTDIFNVIHWVQDELK